MASTSKSIKLEPSGDRKTPTTKKEIDTNKKHVSIDDEKDDKDKALYQRLRKYVMNDFQLQINHYPRPSDSPGMCRLANQTEENYTSTSKTCYRCKRRFQLSKSGMFECKSDRCPNAGLASNSGKNHVHRDNLLNCSGYVELPKNVDENTCPGMYAIDCEMAYTVEGLELTRVSVINFDCDIVYDSYVQPNGRIIDYNTKWSGIEERHLRGVQTCLKDVQKEFQKRFFSDTIFLGHSLESDLKALRIIHSCVVDTSILFPHSRGPPFKRALRNLARDYLGQTIQASDVKGHDSIEDATACIALVKYKLK